MGEATGIPRCMLSDIPDTVLTYTLQGHYVMSEKRESSVPPAMTERLNQVRSLNRLGPVMRALDRFGIGGGKFKGVASQMKEIEEKMSDLVQFPSKFNDVFLEYGWLLSETTNLETARKALELHGNGCPLDAEGLLAADYTGERLDFMVRQWCFLHEFKIRWDHLHEACALTHEGRYLAATPLLLIIADGVGTDAFKKSIFAEGVQLEELNSFAGQPDALPKLVKDMCRIRRKTNSEALYYPYRNGIIHGRDLGYNNQFLNAKCWSFLGNIADVISVRNKQQASEPEPEPSLRDMYKQIVQNSRFKRSMEKWVKRPAIEKRICISADESSSTRTNEPEAALSGFLLAWKTKNYGRMAQMTQYNQELPINRRAGEIREIMQEVTLMDAAIIRIEDKAPALTEIAAELKLRDRDQDYVKVFIFRMLCCDEEGNTAIHGDDGTHWKVNRQYLIEYWGKPWT